MKLRCEDRYCLERSGFTLAEALATLAIAAMIMTAAAGIYMGIKRAEAAVNRRLEGGFTAMEIEQRIAEDIDRLALPGSEVTMSVKNRFEAGGFKVSQMIIENKIYDKDNKPQTFEKIVWQSRVSEDANGLIVYRAHSGYTIEDKMLEEPKEKYERELFIPICSGATLFSIEAIGEDGNTVEQWEGQNLPQAVRVSVSFAAREQDLLGNMTVPPESVKTRTVVINRLRQIPYQFVRKEFGDANDANNIADTNQPDVNEPSDLNDITRPKEEVNEPSRR